MRKGRGWIIAGVILFALQIMSSAGNMNRAMPLFTYRMNSPSCTYQLGSFVGGNIAGIMGSILLLIGIFARRGEKRDRDPLKLGKMSYANISIIALSTIGIKAKRDIIKGIKENLQKKGAASTFFLQQVAETYGCNYVSNIITSAEEVDRYLDMHIKNPSVFSVPIVTVMDLEDQEREYAILVTGKMLDKYIIATSKNAQQTALIIDVKKVGQFVCSNEMDKDGNAVLGA